jgi:hypothetical protein
MILFQLLNKSFLQNVILCIFRFLELISNNSGAVTRLNYAFREIFSRSFFEACAIDFFLRVNSQLPIALQVIHYLQKQAPKRIL